MEVNTEIAEIPTARIDDSVFGIPLGFQAAPFGDFMKAWTASSHPAPSVAAPRRQLLGAGSLSPRCDNQKQQLAYLG